MKRKLAVAACVAAGCIATANSHASTKWYRCTYKVSPSLQIWATEYGQDNAPMFCRELGKGMQRWYGYVPGRPRCTFTMKNNPLNIYVTIRSINRTVGRFYCSSLASMLPDWTRIG
jgi:hypothetical protein